MPVGLTLRFETGTAEDYDAVHNAMGIGGNPPAGLLVHSAGPVHGGWGVTDFWESREHFDTFVRDRLRPGLERLQSPLGTPEVKEFPVHNLERY
jgi:hypothetical protein